MTEEIWKDIKNYEGLYQVSNLGRVKSLDRICSNNIHLKEKIRKSYQNHKGYLITQLSKNGKVKTFQIHRLVAQAFLKNDDPIHKTQINHKNEIKDDNRVENLEFCTSDYNLAYGTRIKRMAKAKNKPVVAKNLATGKEANFNSIKEAAKKLSLWRQSITAVLHGIIKQTGGYTFEFVS